MSEKRQMNLYLDENLIKRVKHVAIEAEQRLSEFVAAALSEYLENMDTYPPNIRQEGKSR